MIVEPLRAHPGCVIYVECVCKYFYRFIFVYNFLKIIWSHDICAAICGRTVSTNCTMDSVHLYLSPISVVYLEPSNRMICRPVRFAYNWIEIVRTMLINLVIIDVNMISLSWYYHDIIYCMLDYRCTNAEYGIVLQPYEMWTIVKAW